jgi:hypothetical protein
MAKEKKIVEDEVVDEVVEVPAEPEAPATGRFQEDRNR